VGDPVGGVGICRATVGWVVFESAITRRVVGWGDHDAVGVGAGGSCGAKDDAIVVSQDRVGHCGRRGVAAVGVDKHFDVVGNEDLKRADHRWFGQRVCIAADKQRADPVFWLLIAVINDGLGGCQDVVLVESA